MNQQAARFHVLSMEREDGRSAFLIGVADMEHLNSGHVYEIQKDIFGELKVVDLGEAKSAENQELKGANMDKFLALANGQHLIPKD